MHPGRRQLLCRVLRLVQEFGATCTAEMQQHFDPMLTGNSAVAVLATLALDGPQRPGQLQPLTSLTSAGLAHLLDRFEELGLVERLDGAVVGDQRAVLVRLTRLGRRREAALVAAAFRGMHEAAPAVKELVLALQDAGARALPVPPRERGGRTDSEAARALSQTGIAMVRSLQLPPPHDKVTDHTAAIALALVAESGGCRPSHLADALAITTGGATRLLDRLEAAGLVERAYGTDPADRRSVLVTITTEGTRQLDRVLGRLQHHVDEVLGAILAIGALLRLPLDPS